MKIKHVAAIYAVFLMLYFMVYDIDGHGSEYSIISKSIIIIWPFLFSNFVWNWKAYDYLNQNAYKDEKSYKKTYLIFIYFGTIFIVLFDIGMTYGIIINSHQ